MLAFISGCNNQIRPSIISPDFATPTSEISSEPLSTQTSLPLRTATPSLIPSLSPKPPITKVFTSTPFPTLSLEKVVELVNTNGGCQFPCWLGVTPGKSKWNEIKPFLLTFSKKGLVEYNSKTYYSIDVSLENSQRTTARIYVWNNLVESIEAYEPIQKLPFWKVLSTYGKPEEVRISPSGHYGGVGNNVLGEFDLVLFYPDMGILTEFHGTTDSAKVLNVCLLDKYLDDHTHWFLWDPQKPMSFAEIGEEIGLPIKMSVEYDYISIDKLTNFNVETFYEKFKQEANQNDCFYVPDPEWQKK